MTQDSSPQPRPFRIGDKVRIVRPEPSRPGEIRHIDPATGEIYVLPDNENAYVKVPPQDLEHRRPNPRRLRDRFEVGEVVRITEGPFADFEGVVEAVFPEQERLRVAAMVFGRATPTEVSYSQVQKGR